MLPVQCFILLWNCADDLSAYLVGAQPAADECGNDVRGGGASGGEFLFGKLSAADVLDDTLVWECGVGHKG